MADESRTQTINESPAPSTVVSGLSKRTHPRQPRPPPGRAEDKFGGFIASQSIPKMLEPGKYDVKLDAVKPRVRGAIPMAVQPSVDRGRAGDKFGGFINHMSYRGTQTPGKYDVKDEVTRPRVRGPNMSKMTVSRSVDKFGGFINHQGYKGQSGVDPGKYDVHDELTRPRVRGPVAMAVKSVKATGRGEEKFNGFANSAAYRGNSGIDPGKYDVKLDAVKPRVRGPIAMGVKPLVERGRGDDKFAGFINHQGYHGASGIDPGKYDVAKSLDAVKPHVRGPLSMAIRPTVDVGRAGDKFAGFINHQSYRGSSDPGKYDTSKSLQAVSPRVKGIPFGRLSPIGSPSPSPSPVRRSRNNP
eukprot:gnl/Spiro4/16600_TR8937_c0_g1_i1.p1 gnl/Spiro4/16600_TR8937_c0_g1~~gnl/Spiro4/16600_TR8937_c0_g1_i1.p1  ORF type:complete len:357 (-),score=73.34 gnl/Spiro4/16600_TR8937_c0_g1_i1:106-1176(-)